MSLKSINVSIYEKNTRIGYPDESKTSDDLSL